MVMLLCSLFFTVSSPYLWNAIIMVFYMKRSFSVYFLLCFSIVMNVGLSRLMCCRNCLFEMVRRECLIKKADFSCFWWIDDSFWYRSSFVLFAVLFFFS